MAEVRGRVVATSSRPSSRQALKHTLLGNVARIFVQLASGIVIARLFGPTSLGVITLGLLAFNGIALVAELGTSSAVVTSGAAPSLRTGTVGQIGVAICGGVVALFCPPFGLLSAGVAWWPCVALAAAVAVQVFAFIPLALLRRQLLHKYVLRAQVLGYAVGYAGTLIVAGVMRPDPKWVAVALLLQSLTTLAIALWAVRVNSADEHFGRKIPRSVSALLTNCANWLTESGDNLLVGYILGPTALGLYSRAYQIPRVAADAAVQGGQQVILPLVAKRKREGRPASDLLRLALTAGLALALPFTFLAINSLFFATLLFGEQYAFAAVALGVLCLGMPFHALTAFAGPILAGAGSFRQEAIRQGFMTAALLLLATLGALIGHSIVWVAAAVTVTYVLRGLVIFVGACGACGASVAERMRASGRTLLAALAGTVTLLTTLSADAQLSRLSISAVVLLASVTLVLFTDRDLRSLVGALVGKRG